MSDLNAGSGPWTCPFCPLLCDSLGLSRDAASQRLLLSDTDCPRARQALDDLPLQASGITARLNGQPCDTSTAIAAAARALKASRQPLFAGLGCDVAASRALYPLAHDSGAICDAVNGTALFHGLRALQDRGAFTTTQAEVRNRADLIVCITGSPLPRLPEFFRRCGLGEEGVAQRHVVLLGGSATDLAPLADLPGVSGEVIALQGDLFDTLTQLTLAVAGRAAPPPLQALAQRLHAARYSVLAWEAAQLPAQGALIVEALNRVVGTLNRKTRAAMLPLGGGDGAATANQVQAWLTGLPLRSRVAAGGIEHEPLRFGAEHLLADGAVDLLLWLQVFNAQALPPPAPGLPRIVLGPPAMAARLPAAAGAPDVFIPVATPGIGSEGHAFRTDGVVLMPLHRRGDQGLPGAAQVLQQLHTAFKDLP